MKGNFKTHLVYMVRHVRDMPWSEGIYRHQNLLMNQIITKLVIKKCCFPIQQNLSSTSDGSHTFDTCHIFKWWHMTKFGRLQNLVLQIKSSLPIAIKKELKINKYSFVDKILKETNLPVKVKRELKNKYFLLSNSLMKETSY